MDRIDQILLPPVWKTCFSTLGWIWHAKNDLVILQKFWELGWPPPPHFGKNSQKIPVFFGSPPLTKNYKNAWFLCKLGDFYTIIFLVHIGCWEQCIIFGANWKLCNFYFAQYCTFYINAYFLVIFLVQIGCFWQCTSCQSSAVNVFWCHFRWGLAGDAGDGFFLYFSSFRFVF